MYYRRLWVEVFLSTAGVHLVLNVIKSANHYGQYDQWLTLFGKMVELQLNEIVGLETCRNVLFSQNSADFRLFLAKPEDAVEFTLNRILRKFYIENIWHAFYQQLNYFDDISKFFLT